jgi:hypothetical protein
LSQYYVGVKQVFAWPAEKDGRPGYAVVYRYGQPDAYQSWSPKDEFEKFYFPQGNDPTRVTPAMVDGFMGSVQTESIGKTTITHSVFRNGFEAVESSSCVDPKNYDEEIGKKICLERTRDRVWHLLGFVLQWAKHGLRG